MKRFRVLDYLKKYQVPIIILSLLAGLVFYQYMQMRQTYTASAIISYTNSGAETGLAPDGSEIDLSEIYSSSVMAEVFERMGLDYTEHNLDEIRSRVSVTAVVTDEDTAVQEALNAAGEEVTTVPTEYYVSFTANTGDSDRPEEFARQVLDNMLDIYIQNYGENHINSLAAANDVSGLDESAYDYLEMVELLDESITGAMNSIYNQYTESNTFRSSANGYSFSDLYEEFDLLRRIDLADAYAYILNNQVTKDRAALLAKYQNRIQQFYLENDASETEINAINNVISSYVQMMRESGNTNITYEYILDNIHAAGSAGTESTEDTGTVDQTVEYDVLMNDYVSNRTEYEWNLIDVAYCQYIIGIYTGESSVGTTVELEEYTSEGSLDQLAEGMTETAADVTGTEETAVPEAGNEETEAVDTAEAEMPSDGETAAGEDSAEDAGTASAAAGVEIQQTSVSESEALETTSAMVSDLVSKTNELYDILLETNQEYNEYAGAANISLLTNIVVIANQRTLLYAAIVVVIFLCVFCVAAILLGRLGDIVDFYVYRDRKYELPNRVGCDRFMQSYANHLLPENFSCIVLRLIKIREKNGIYGREAMDDMMLKFNSIIKETFPNNEECFIALNGVGQYIIYSKNMPEEHMITYTDYLKREVEEYNKSASCKIEYECGMAESKATGAYRIKLLLINAMHNLTTAVSL